MDINCIPDKCERCGLNCELAQEHKQLVQKNYEGELPLYMKSDLENCFVYKFFKPIPCGSKNVTDGINDDFKIDVKYNPYQDKWEFNFDGEAKWNPKRPVCISAQTGRGKNWFIEKTLLPYVENLNLKKETDFKVLIVSNRIALSLQTKDRLSSKIYYDDENNDPIYPYYKKFKCADVVNYQGLKEKLDLLRRKQQTTHSKYIFVVCDEAHFFTSDSNFNPYTGYILSEIVDIFKDAIRIYMTATPYECLPYIILYEHEIWRQFASNNYEHIEELVNYKVGSYSDKKGVFYHFTRDYGYLDIKCFSDYKELIEIIQNSGNEKWLVFRDNIAAGKKFKNELDSTDGNNEESTGQGSGSDKKNRYYAVDKSSKNEERYQNIVLNECLGSDTDVLITTSVLDNGVNFRDIKNVVVSDISRVKCLQMLGRARVSNNQRITLYIQKLNETLLKRRLEYLGTQKIAYIDHNIFDDDHGYTFFNKYYGDGATDHNCRNFRYAVDWFGLYKSAPCKLYKNDIARSMMDLLISICESIKNEMEKANEEDIDPGQKYLEYQYGWFGKEYGSDTDTTFVTKEKAKAALITFLDSYVETLLLVNEEDKNSDTAKFSKEFTILYDKAFPRKEPNAERVYRSSKINKLLEQQQLYYKLESVRETTACETTGKKRTYWKVVRFDISIYLMFHSELQFPYNRF